MEVDAATKVHTIAALNDRLRIQSMGGRIMLTQSVVGLNDIKRAQVLRAIRTFSDFNDGNNPHGERDFVAVEVCGETYFCKIDYCAPDMEHGSEDPSDPKKTVRVMTIMHSSDY